MSETVSEIALLNTLPTRIFCDECSSINNNVTSVAHNAVARELVSASTVMVKNDGGALPLDISNTVKNIAVVGDAGHDSPIVHGGGSGQVGACRLHDIPFFICCSEDHSYHHTRAQLPVGDPCLHCQRATPK